MKLVPFESSSELMCRYLKDISGQWSGHFWPYEEVLSSLSQASNTLMMIFDESQVYGAIFYNFIVHESELLYLYVSPEARGRGLAKQLMMAYFHDTGQRSTEAYFLEVRESNRGAIALYETLEYKEIDRRKSYYKDGETAIIMKRDQIELPG